MREGRDGVIEAVVVVILRVLRETLATFAVKRYPSWLQCEAAS
jgi:hypothetical protein